MSLGKIIRMPAPEADPAEGASVDLRIGSQRIKITVKAEIAPAQPEPSGKLIQMPRLAES